MGYFPVRFDSRVVIYEHKMFIRLATGHGLILLKGTVHFHTKIAEDLNESMRYCFTV